MILRYLKNESLRVLPVFIYFLLVFLIINQFESFVFIQAGIAPLTFLEIVLSAGLIAKVILIADYMAFISLFDKKPLLYPILWKTIWYCVFILLVRFIMRYLNVALVQDKGADGDFLFFTENFKWSLFLSVQLLYFLFLFIYQVFRELYFALGNKRLKKMFLG